MTISRRHLPLVLASLAALTRVYEAKADEAIDACADPCCPCCHATTMTYIHENMLPPDLEEWDPSARDWPKALKLAYVQASWHGRLGWHWWSKAEGLHGPYADPSDCWLASPFNRK